MKHAIEELVLALDKMGASTDQIIYISHNPEVFRKNSEDIAKLFEGGVQYKFLDENVSNDGSSSVYMGGYTIHFLPEKKGRTERTVLDRIVIKQFDSPAEVAGLIIPDSERKKIHKGEVVIVGPGGRDHEGRLIPMTVKVGDIVAYSEFATTKVEIDGIEYILIKEGDLELIY